MNFRKISSKIWQNERSFAPDHKKTKIFQIQTRNDRVMTFQKLIVLWSLKQKQV